MKEELISIVVPVYNSEKFLKDTLITVLEQTYTKWELLLVDDCSTDNSSEIIFEYSKSDERIKYIKLEENSGAAKARNKGIELASGRYICFLDADDKWEKTKLEQQIQFMNTNNCAFSFTSYQFADKDCIPNGKIVVVPDTINYEQALKNTTIWTSTVMFDMKKLNKEQIYMPDVKRGQDTATWWKVLKQIDKAYGLTEVLSYYRRSDETLSSNKLIALKRTWNLYRKVEKLSMVKSIYNFSCYVFNAIKRRV